MARKSQTQFSPLFYNVVAETHGSEARRYGGKYAEALERSDYCIRSKEHPSEEPTYSSVPWGLQPIGRILRCLGLLYSKKRNNSVSPAFTYSLILCCLVWLNVVRYFFSYATVTSFNSQLFGKLAIHVWYTQCAIVFTIYLCIVSPGLQVLIDKMENYAFMYNINSGKYIRKVSKISITITFLILFVMLVMNVTIGFLVGDPLLYSHKFLAPFHDQNSETLFYIKIVYIFIHVYLSSIWTFATTHLVILCLGIRKNFQQLSMEIAQQFPYANETGLNIEHFRQRHQKLCRIVKVTDRLFSLYNMTIYFTGIPLLCFIIYTFAFTSIGGHVISLGVSVFQMILINIQMGVLTAVASSVSIAVSLFLFPTKSFINLTK